MSDDLTVPAVQPFRCDCGEKAPQTVLAPSTCEGCGKRQRLRAFPVGRAAKRRTVAVPVTEATLEALDVEGVTIPASLGAVRLTDLAAVEAQTGAGRRVLLTVEAEVDGLSVGKRGEPYLRLAAVDLRHFSWIDPDPEW